LSRSLAISQSAGSGRPPQLGRRRASPPGNPGLRPAGTALGRTVATPQRCGRWWSTRRVRLANSTDSPTLEKGVRVAVTSPSRKWTQPGFVDSSARRDLWPIGVGAALGLRSVAVSRRGHHPRLVHRPDGRFEVQCPQCQQVGEESRPIGIDMPITNRAEAEDIARNHVRRAA
jgi:hypothetical protein